MMQNEMKFCYVIIIKVKGAGLVSDLPKKYNLPIPYIRIFKVLRLGLGLGLNHKLNLKHVGRSHTKPAPSKPNKTKFTAFLLPNHNHVVGKVIKKFHI